MQESLCPAQFIKDFVDCVLIHIAVVVAVTRNGR